MTQFSAYRPFFGFSNPHINTIVPNFFRKIRGVHYTRKPINTPDGDILNLDLHTPDQNRKRIVLLLHGLEGDSQASYIKAAARQAERSGYHAAALNMRSCGGEMNPQKEMYHSGKSDDVDTACRYLIESGYREIHLLGFSLGGNIALKLAAETDLSEIKSTAAVSVPCRLAASSQQMNSPINRLYLNRFLKRLKRKAQHKINQFPDCGLDKDSILKSRTLKEFDNAFTAPIHGFADADDYYSRCSSSYMLSQIKIPALILNAQDDSFLSPECYPYQEAKINPNLTLLTPANGGHVGFIDRFPLSRPQWHERTVFEFMLCVGGEG